MHGCLGAFVGAWVLPMIILAVFGISCHPRVSKECSKVNHAAFRQCTWNEPCGSRGLGIKSSLISRDLARDSRQILPKVDILDWFTSGKSRFSEPVGFNTLSRKRTTRRYRSICLARREHAQNYFAPQGFSSGNQNGYEDHIYGRTISVTAVFFSKKIVE